MVDALTQLARSFRTYADDQVAMKSRMRGQRHARECTLRAELWRDAAFEVEALAQRLVEQERGGHD